MFVQSGWRDQMQLIEVSNIIFYGHCSIWSKGLYGFHIKKTKQGMGKIFGLTQTNQNIHYFLNRFYSDIKIITVCSQPAFCTFIGWGKILELAIPCLFFVVSQVDAFWFPSIVLCKKCENQFHGLLCLWCWLVEKWLDKQSSFHPNGVEKLANSFELCTLFQL